MFLIATKIHGLQPSLNPRILSFEGSAVPLCSKNNIFSIFDREKIHRTQRVWTHETWVLKIGWYPITTENDKIFNIFDGEKKKSLF
jgi:hypothetical protein